MPSDSNISEDEFKEVRVCLKQPALSGFRLTHVLLCVNSPSFLIMENRALPLDKWGLQITPAAVGRAGGVEGTRRKALLPVSSEWLPEGSYDNSSQPCPSRRLTSSTPLQQNGTAYQLAQWGVVSTHPLVPARNAGRSWNETVLAVGIGQRPPMSTAKYHGRRVYGWSDWEDRFKMCIHESYSGLLLPCTD